MDNTNDNLPQFLDIPELLSRDEAAKLLHVSISYIDHLKDLPCYKLGKKKLFDKAELLNYLKNNHLKPSKTISKTDAININKEDANE